MGPPWVPGSQTRESSAWKLEERRPLGLPRVSMETCVLYVAPMLPPDGFWYLRPRPKMPFRFQRRHFRRSSACTWEKGVWSSLLHCLLGCSRFRVLSLESYPVGESKLRDWDAPLGGAELGGHMGQGQTKALE